VGGYDQLKALHDSGELMKSIQGGA
jgi:hypothetical protein